MEDKDIFENEWEQTESPEAEIKQIQKSIRRRNWKIITISVLLAAALMIGCVYGAVPLIERLYWHPSETTYGSDTDLATTLHAYTELFTPGYNAYGVSYRRSGFASYDLEVQVFSTAQDRVITATGALHKNLLSMDQNFIDPMNQYYPFARWSTSDYTPNTVDMESLRQRLNALPEYIRLEATISFPRDLSMEELMEFRAEQQDLLITWVAVRGADPSEPLPPLVGMDPFTGGSRFDGLWTEYPYFNASEVVNAAYPDAADLEQHFKTRLEYYTDQLEKGRGLYRYTVETLCTIQTYVEENGVYTYGCVVTASPKTLLALLDEGIVCDIRLVDCWIDIG